MLHILTAAVCSQYLHAGTYADQQVPGKHDLQEPFAGTVSLLWHDGRVST